MTFEPPAVPPSYTPQPQQPSYAQQQQPSYAQQQQPSYAQQPQQQQPRAKNTLGLVSAILGASGYVLGFIFTFIQVGMYSVGTSSSIGLLSGVHSVLDALLGLGAVALGVVAYLKGGPSKLLAIVGATLGITLLLGVLNGLIFTIALPLVF